MRAVLLFDIDGVIRDVGRSYRRAIKETVFFYTGQKPDSKTIDDLKSEGDWNNDWEASMELIRRSGTRVLPAMNELIGTFNGLYFGSNPDADSKEWNGFILDEDLLVEPRLFSDLSDAGVRWGFVSGAERSSALFVLRDRLGLQQPPLVAMGEAKDKPNPEGFLRLANELGGEAFKEGRIPAAYVGDTVADIRMVVQAQTQLPNHKLWGFGIAPPHLNASEKSLEKQNYQLGLLKSGATGIIERTSDALEAVEKEIRRATNNGRS